jgi:phage/plasmid-like protein (TIGR03299 family)
MSHDLDFTADGKARFAYAGHTAPWHRLGQKMTGLSNVDQMLTAAAADFNVLVTKVAAIDDEGNLIRHADGTPVIVDDSRATVRQDLDGSYNALTTVGTRFVPTQNRETLERALAVVGASSGDAVIDTVGVLREGARFFASIDLGALIIDPLGANDRIDRYLLVFNGHDGKVPITYANTDVRAVCQNTVTMGLKTATRTFKARHTRNSVDFLIEDARQVLSISTDWAKSFKETAEQMMSIEVPQSSARMDRVLNDVFPLKKDASDLQKRNHDEVTTMVRAIYANEKNVGKVGANGWGVYNAVVEYLDHYRPGTPEERALTVMDDTSWVVKAKLTAQQSVFALA